MIWSVLSLRLRLKQREMRVTLDGTCRPPLPLKNPGLTKPYALFIHVPSQHTMRRFLARGPPTRSIDSIDATRSRRPPSSCPLGFARC